MSKLSPLGPQPFPQVGNANADDVYQAVGRALSAWETTEEDFAALFNALITPLHMSFALRRSYGNIAAARGRNEIIGTAADVFFRNFPDKDLQTRLRALLKKYSDAGARRNEIAYGVVAGHVWESSKSFSGFFLGPSFWNTNKRGVKLEPAYMYNVEMITNLTEQFVQLRYSSREIVRQVEARFLQAPLESQKRH
jgi:hypothetical protein